jgi:hypothetical protein
MSNIVINILAIVGFVILISYLISYIYYYFKSMNDQTLIQQINPPPQYMQQSGIKCPDYWVNTGVEADGTYICKNMFNLNVNTSTVTNKKEDSAKCADVKCFNNFSEKTIKFSPIDSKNTWEPNDPNGKKSYTDKEKYKFVTSKGTGTTSRCDWIKCCGGGVTDDDDAKSWSTKGVWQGVQNTCLYDPSIESM